ncbi:glycoside hydrolase family 32 protein [Amphibacillus cookii]|uniref:glycoside hydrolase family 32 protein n=1 Tax=Amphibacillus cookii TaxID=767787 RepID=UPI001EF86167|nr:glycoside hydrolase family 32 protein [Amphibacillus cookii]
MVSLLQTNNQFRPKIHFAPEKNWMNDPNGMVFFNGIYHLFFQYNPNDSVWGPMHWGHAISKDMIHWEEQAIALFPDELGMIFSGSIVIDWHNTSGFFEDQPGMVAIFTHHLDQPSGPPKQYQSLAYSKDEGKSWVSYTGNPVLKHPDKVDFRDPKVFWYEKMKRWVMILATGQTVMIYTSINLIDWQFKSEFGEGKGYQEGVWECPDLFELQIEGTNKTKWVMLVSVGDNPDKQEGSKTQYFIGDFDGAIFTPQDDHLRWLDYGKDNYAGVSFSDIPKADGRRIYMGWMSNWRYANQVPTGEWRGQMTLPRKLSLVETNEGMFLKQVLVEEMMQYMYDCKPLAPNQPINNLQVPLFEVPFMVEMLVDPLEAKEIDFTFQTDYDEELIVKLDCLKKAIILDRSRIGIVEFSELFSAEQVLPVAPNKPYYLQMVIDHSSIEIFNDDGRYALTSLVYPRAAFDKLVITSDSSEAKLIEGKCKRIKIGDDA